MYQGGKIMEYTFEMNVEEVEQVVAPAFQVLHRDYSGLGWWWQSIA